MKKSDKQNMLTNAFVDIVSSMNIPDNAVSNMLGVEKDYMDKLRKAEQCVELEGSAGKGVAQFINTMDQLYRLVGHKEGAAVQWLREQNKSLAGKAPLDLLATEKDGLEKVSRYIKESYRSH